VWGKADTQHFPFVLLAFPKSSTLPLNILLSHRGNNGFFLPGLRHTERFWHPAPVPAQHAEQTAKHRGAPSHHGLEEKSRLGTNCGVTSRKQEPESEEDYPLEREGERLFGENHIGAGTWGTIRKLELKRWVGGGCLLDRRNKISWIRKSLVRAQTRNKPVWLDNWIRIKVERNGKGR
jgi:hypothetical protein